MLITSPTIDSFAHCISYSGLPVFQIKQDISPWCLLFILFIMSKCLLMTLMCLHDFFSHIFLGPLSNVASREKLYLSNQSMVVLSTFPTLTCNSSPTLCIATIVHNLICLILIFDYVMFSLIDSRKNQELVALASSYQSLFYISIIWFL